MKPLHAAPAFALLIAFLSSSGCMMDRWHDHGSRDQAQGQTRCDPDEEHHCRPISR